MRLTVDVNPIVSPNLWIHTISSLSPGKGERVGVTGGNLERDAEASLHRAILGINVLPVICPVALLGADCPVRPIEDPRRIQIRQKNSPVLWEALDGPRFLEIRFGDLYCPALSFLRSFSNCIFSKAREKA